MRYSEVWRRVAYPALYASHEEMLAEVIDEARRWLEIDGPLEAWTTDAYRLDSGTHIDHGCEVHVGVPVTPRHADEGTLDLEGEADGHRPDTGRDT